MSPWWSPFVSLQADLPVRHHACGTGGTGTHLFTCRCSILVGLSVIHWCHSISSSALLICHSDLHSKCSSAGHLPPALGIGACSHLGSPEPSWVRRGGFVFLGHTPRTGMPIAYLTTLPAHCRESVIPAPSAKLYLLSLGLSSARPLPLGPLAGGLVDMDDM